MTYIIEPSTFGIGYSIFRLEVVRGRRIKRYLADVSTVAEGKTICVGARCIYCPSEPKQSVNLITAA